MPSFKRRPSTQEISTFGVQNAVQNAEHTPPRKRRRRHKRKSGRLTCNNSTEIFGVLREVTELENSFTAGGENSFGLRNGNSSGINPIKSLQTQSIASQENLAGHEILGCSFKAQIEDLLSCGICKLRLSQPFATVPCGHVACYHCLKKWFERTVTSDQSHISEPGPSLLQLKKTCPSCRAVLISRPVEMYTLKAIIEVIATEPRELKIPETRSSDLPVGLTLKGDLWDGIFYNDQEIRPVQIGGIVDHEDGGITRCPRCLHEVWEGVCTGCNETLVNLEQPEVLPGSNSNISSEIDLDEKSDQFERSSSDGYDGSFIDDENVLEGSVQTSYQEDESPRASEVDSASSEGASSLTDSDGDVEPVGPDDRAQLPRKKINRKQVVSSDED